ncbi:uncharacterized protein FIBRA_09528 [Fibroporia radiculosa]|uniref:Uncharacterized protein n=1 Tax=Fibroporia radiculosa TaxID=599839 RepID=J7RHZ9_9APHY|nr:uncharacterized protein FIBRA_09528 [Fibroporia radiculosa]CCM07187.1 predicted protein [Fibroporia radiculosa]
MLEPLQIAVDVIQVLLVDEGRRIFSSSPFQGGKGLEGAARSRQSPSEIDEESLTLLSKLITVGEAIGSSNISPVAVTYSRVLRDLTTKDQEFNC